jgi:dTDP-4-amino-4,6-dideoxygalactose transaminase
VIGMNDFRAEPPELRMAMLEAARRVFESGSYVLGREVEAFEGEWARACGVQHAVGVGNGLDALEIAFRGLGIGPGDEVITPPMTAFATVLAVIRAGATPVFADIDPASALMSCESAARCVSPRTRAVLLVHLYGQVRGMEAWMSFCAGRGIHLVEDCAQAHKAQWKGRVAGNFGVAGAFSFYPTKNLGAIGDAGMLVTNDDPLAERARRLRNYGQSDRYHHSELGLNSRLDELQAAILSARARYLADFIRRRGEIAAAYRANLRNPLVEPLAAPEEPGSHVHHLFVVLCERRDRLQAHLEQRQVQALIHYPIPAHRQEPCSGVKRDPAGLGHSERHAATCLSLPCHPQMSDADVEQVIAAVNSFQA